MSNNLIKLSADTNYWQKQILCKKCDVVLDLLTFKVDFMSILQDTRVLKQWIWILMNVGSI